MVKGKQTNIGKDGSLAEGHAAVLREVTFNGSMERGYGYGKAIRVVSNSKTPAGVVTPELVEEKVSKNGVILYPEFAEYIYNIEGVAKRLLLFIIFHQLNPVKNTFLFNDHVIDAFNNYCKLLTGSINNPDTVKQALRKLVASNLIINLERGKYMLNPMIGGCNSLALRRTLIADYSKLLLEKGKDPVEDFYPKS